MALSLSEPIRDAGLTSGAMLVIATVVGGGCFHCLSRWRASGFRAPP
jgi:hypothetical protein